MLYKCFKAKYFPRCNFLEAEDVPNSSYVWKSILAAQPILKKGSYWRVGDGSEIRVLKDKWIPNYPINKVLHPPAEEEWEWRVSELIDWSAKIWDRQLLDLKFHHEDADAISQIPLSCRQTNDALFWLHSIEGEYSVITGYHLARELKNEMDVHGESSSSVGHSMVWGKLRKLHIPNKVRIFAWCACHDILPTRVKLHKDSLLDDTCLLCNRDSEFALHALWDCSVAQDVWVGCARRLQKMVGGQLDVLQLVELLLEKLSTEELEQFFVQAWLIWSQRNSIIHGGNMQDPSRLNKRAMEFLEEFREAQQHLVVPTSIARDA